MSAKLAAIFVFSFALLLAAALLIAGVLKPADEAEKTFAGAQFIQLPQARAAAGKINGREAHGGISKHTLVVPGVGAGRARG